MKIIDFFKSLKSKNILIYSLSFCTFILFVLIALFIFKPKPIPLYLEGQEFVEKQSLIQLDKNSKLNFIKDSGLATYKFTNNQKKYINQTFTKNKNCSLVLRIQVSLSEEQLLTYNANKKYNLEYGFVQDNNQTYIVKADAASIYRLYDEVEDKDVALTYKGIVDISLAFEKNSKDELVIPDGFFVNSELQCSILNAYVAPSLIGFDKSSDIYFYGFSSNGGILHTNSDSFDFSGAGLVFANQNSKEEYMPEFLVKLSNKPEHVSKINTSVFVKVKIDSENIRIKNVSHASQLIIPSCAFNKPFSVINITQNSVCVESILLRNFTNVHNSKINMQNGSDIFIPIRTDPGLVLDWNKEHWRNLDYELFEWDRFPGILIFDTRNYQVQDNFFRRLAFFAEKQEYKGTLLTNEELGDMHGFNALDYNTKTLKDFFNKALDENFTLNREELLLRKILIQNGLLILQDDGMHVKEGYGALVSISQESYSALRWQLMAHEAWHTLFFIDEEFRNFVAAVYYSTDPKTLEFLIDYFVSQSHLGYDIHDEYLMQNEFMAYIMQQRVSSTAAYFVNHAWWDTVMTYTPELSRYIINTQGKGFEESATALNDFVFDKYGLIAGNVSLVTFLD